MYKWKDASATHNDGAQVVCEYRNSDGKFIGQTERFEDQVKLNSRGQLISRLSITQPERQVVAYSVCDAE
ncbi:MAG: hypothetical protein HC883_00390 [Bdellovibrionaceae bacterium]|nr:hypothetical protein [Pseudobdellovibrionaceae bacterium]